MSAHLQVIAKAPGRSRHTRTRNACRSHSGSPPTGTRGGRPPGTCSAGPRRWAVTGPSYCTTPAGLWEYTMLRMLVVYSPGYFKCI